MLGNWIWKSSVSYKFRSKLCRCLNFGLNNVCSSSKCRRWSYNRRRSIWRLRIFANHWAYYSLLVLVSDIDHIHNSCSSFHRPAGRRKASLIRPSFGTEDRRWTRRNWWSRIGSSKWCFDKYSQWMCLGSSALAVCTGRGVGRAWPKRSFATSLPFRR